MTTEFVSIANPTEKLCSELTATSPMNPFYTYNYVEAQRVIGFDPWVFFLRDEGRIQASCNAFMKSGRLSRSLEIVSAPALKHQSLFWGGLIQFCKKMRITHLNVNTFASQTSQIPSIDGETRRRKRTEFILELQQPDLWKKLSKNHARNVKRGWKAGLRVQRARDQRACLTHAQLIAASIARRENRGDQVSENVELDAFEAFIERGAGELFQALLGESVLSSVLVLHAAKGAYYHSAGNNPQGMDTGASHFLITEIANILKDQSIHVFNLGGSDPSNPGLSRFKAGFGTVSVDLEAADYFFGSRIRLKLIENYHLLNSKYGHFIKWR